MLGPRTIGKNTYRLLSNVVTGLTVAIVFFSFLGFFEPVYAQVDPGLAQVGASSGLNTQTDLPTIIGRIINIVLSFVGIILLCILVYAGYLWMTAGGDNEKVEQAKKWIKNGIIGLVIIVSAYAITSFIIRMLSDISESGGGVTTDPFANNGGFPSSAGSLGRGIIEMHVPGRDATGVPRNTGIIITFKEPIKLSTVIAGYNDNNTPTVLSDDSDRATTIGLNADVVKVYPSGKREQALTSTQARVAFTDDRRTFVIRPVEYLGSPTVDTDYTVEFVGGANGLKLEDGSAAFKGSFGSGYKWQFQVSTLVDNTPPKLVAAIPKKDSSYAPNVVIQLLFNEAVDPISASGKFQNGSGFTNVTVDAGSSRPSGDFVISNQYRTVEFIPEQRCGVNTCGSPIFCLPTNATIGVSVKAATLSTEPPAAALAGSYYDGVVDIAGNSFDGDGDGIAKGSASDAVEGEDHATWTFSTTDKPNIDPPVIQSTTPVAGDITSSSNIARDAVLNAIFTSLLRSSTLTTSNILLQTNEPLRLEDTFWWQISYDALTSSNAEVNEQDNPAHGRMSIDHRLFVAATGTGMTAILPIYQPVIGSGVQNIYQNCFVPAASETCAANSNQPYCCDDNPDAQECKAPQRLP